MKKILLTGGLGILGKAITKQLIKYKFKVIIFDKKPLNSSEKKFFDKNSIEYFQVDLLNYVLLEKISKNKIFKNLYGIINNAAIDTPPNQNPRNKNFFDLNIKSIEDETFNNIKIYLYTTKIFGKYLYNNKFGVILNISSIYGMRSPDQDIYKLSKLKFEKPISYTISKSSIYGFSKYLSHYFRKRNVRVNTISLSGIFNNQNKLFVKNFSKKIPLNRMMESNEAAKVITFLINDDSSYINGTNIIVDGGYNSI